MLKTLALHPHGRGFKASLSGSRSCSASTTHERFEVTRNGARAAVILGADDDALIETIEVLSDPHTVRDLRRALGEFASGDTVSSDEMRERMKAAGRLRQ